jgi:hypothetical protein
MQIKESTESSETSDNTQTTSSSSLSLSKTKTNSLNETSAIVEKTNNEINTALLNPQNIN